MTRTTTRTTAATTKGADSGRDNDICACLWGFAKLNRAKPRVKPRDISGSLGRNAFSLWTC
eukprot:3647005-Lingulodinium_polyedra.AAC.1